MEPRIILALDGMSADQCLELADKVKGVPGLWGFKGNTLVRGNYEIISELKQRGRVFADLKLHDIPNTGLNDINDVLKFEPDFLTVHASGGVEMMRTIARNTQGKTIVLAVTVLTSLDEDDCQLIYGCSVKAAVLKLGRMALLAGVDHLVCSAKDLSVFKPREEFKNIIKITPAIRPLWWQAQQEGYDDQKRKTTARQAIDNGANLLVIGRPITKASDPAEAIRLTMEEIEGN